MKLKWFTRGIYIQGEKLTELSVSSFLCADNYAVVNKVFVRDIEYST